VATPFEVRILTAEKTVLETQVTHLQIPGSEGFLLKPGPLTVTYPDGRREVFAVSGGFFEVAQNRAVVLADAIERPEEIDVARAEAARDRAQQRLAERTAEIDALRAELALRRAITRIQVASRRKGA
jgi:F-type H+-transporting ATPase subunit epsilon